MKDSGWVDDGVGGRAPLGRCGGAGRTEVHVSVPLDDERWRSAVLRLEADGRDVVVEVPDGGAWPPASTSLIVRLEGDLPGSLRVQGPGWVNAVRGGRGDGDAVRDCKDGFGAQGYAVRRGSGDGNAVVRGHSRPTFARREGSGSGHALGLEPKRDAACRCERLDSGRGFAWAAGRDGLDGGDDGALALHDWFVEDVGRQPPEGFSRPVMALVRAVVDRGWGRPSKAADFDDLVSCRLPDGDEWLEWEQFDVALAAARRVCAPPAVGRLGDWPPADSPVGEAWGAFAARFRAGEGLGESFQGLMEAIGDEIDSENPSSSPVVKARAKSMRCVAESLACLDAVAAAGREADDGLFIACGYLRQAVVRAGGVFGIFERDRRLVRAAVSEAAELARGRDPSPGPGR